MNRSDVCDRFLAALPFPPYPFQEDALLAWFGSDRGVMICAPTGMGKTLIAEAAVFESLHSRKRLYYTTPLIALTDQKFREFQEKAEAWGFPATDVGLITGNRRVNPDAIIRVVVAEILLNHLLENDPSIGQTAAVVMDEFHFFQDTERGVVWELSLVLLPRAIRLMLLSATVGNPGEFVRWLQEHHGRDLQMVLTVERKVPLEFHWVADRLLTEFLPGLATDLDESNRSPALVFSFIRDACWDVAERLKGLRLVGPARRAEIESLISAEDFTQGIGPKLKQMLLSGVGVHHAGVLPKYKEIVERLFLRKLIPFVACTETLAAGINLPARSVVVTTLVKGKPREEKLILPSVAHQIFGRAGRPQFDAKGYVYSLAHEDDARIVKWKEKMDRLDAQSHDPAILRMRKELERKKPSRRKTEKYWTQEQFQLLIRAGPANLSSRSMIPYRILIYLIAKSGDLSELRAFLSKRFNTAERLALFVRQLDGMIANLKAMEFITVSEDGGRVTPTEAFGRLMNFRSLEPLYGDFLSKQLARADLREKFQAIESVLTLPPAISRHIQTPDDLPPGPLQAQFLEPMLIQLGLISAFNAVETKEDEFDEWSDEKPRPPTFPEMLKMLFDSKLPQPEPVEVQPKWVAGALWESGGRDFYKFIRSRDLMKNEGLILRHLLRLVILVQEFSASSGGDPDYAIIGEVAEDACRSVDPRYTERFLTAEKESAAIGMV